MMDESTDTDVGRLYPTATVRQRPREHSFPSRQSWVAHFYMRGHYGRNQDRRQFRHMARSMQVRVVLAPTVWEGSERSRSLQAYFRRTRQRDHSGHNGCKFDVGGSRARSGKQAFGGRVVGTSRVRGGCPSLLHASASAVTLQWGVEFPPALLFDRTGKTHPRSSRRPPTSPSADSACERLPPGCPFDPRLDDAACNGWDKKNPDESELFIRTKVLDAPPEI